MALDKKNLLIRVLTGVVLGPTIIFSFLTYQTTLGLVTTIVILASFEFIELSSLDLKDNFLKLFLALAIGTSSLVYGFGLRSEYAGILPYETELIFFFAFFVIVFTIVVRVKELLHIKRVIESAVFAIIYIGLFLSFFYNINILYGGVMCILTLSSVWAYDSGAYFAGSLFGKHKISKVISPKKSWEGFFGGILLTYIYILIFQSFLWIYGEIQINPFQAVVFAVMVGIFDTIGDLTESVFKRYYGVKDSGEVLPGHGGMLDRIDGLLLVGPMWYFLLKIFGI